MTTQSVSYARLNVNKLSTRFPTPPTMIDTRQFQCMMDSIKTKFEYPKELWESRSKPCLVTAETSFQFHFLTTRVGLWILNSLFGQSSIELLTGLRFLWKLFILLFVLFVVSTLQMRSSRQPYDYSASKNNQLIDVIWAWAWRFLARGTTAPNPYLAPEYFHHVFRPPLI